MTDPMAAAVAPPTGPLVQRRPGVSWIKLTVDPRSAGIARRFACDVAAGHGHDADLVALAASELTTNALRAAARLAATTGHPWRHDDTPVHLGVTATNRWVLIAVRDPDPGEPAIHHAAPDEESGRGLFLLHALGVRMWTTHTDYYKVVHLLAAAPGVEFTAAELAAIGAPA